MRNIPSPHGGQLHHRHNRHEGALREYDGRPDDAPRGRRERHGSRHGQPHAHPHWHGEDRAELQGQHHRFGPRSRGRGGPHAGRGRNSLAAKAFHREGGRDIAHAAQEIRGALHTLLHRGSPEQLAAGQRLLDETRRGLYLILAAESDTTQSESTDEATASAEPVDATQGAGTIAEPTEIDESPET